MGKLLQNERVKLYKKPSTWVLSSILVALMLFFVIFIRVMTLLFSGSTASSDARWQSFYTHRLQESQQQQESTELSTRIQAKYNAAMYQYLLDNEISPDDWRTDPVYLYYLNLSNAEYVDIVLQEGGSLSIPEESGRQQLEAYRQNAAQYKAILEANDWKEYIRLQIRQLEEGDTSFSTIINLSSSGVTISNQQLETPQERQVVIEILQMQIDMDVKPLPQYNEYYLGNGSSSREETWKRDQLSTLQSNKLSLLRGENMSTQTPLTKSATAKLEVENRVIEEELRTNTVPVDPENSFLGMLDAFTGNLSLITLLIIVLAGGIISSEFSTGTVKLLLITPHRRQKIFWAKALLLVEITAIILGSTFVLAFICSAVFNGFAGIGAMTVISLFGQVVRLPLLVVIVCKYLLLMLPVLTYGGLAMMLSAVTRKTSVAIAVSLLLMYGSQIGMLLLVAGSVELLGAPLPGLKFLLFANTDLSYYLPSASDMAQQMSMGMNLQLAQYDTTMSLGFSVLILLVYLGCFLWIARDSFCRRDIK